MQSSIAYTLGANVENLELTGAAAINGNGNTLNNALVGNSAANRLDGGAGADAMTGGGGNDTYVVDNAGDLVVEAAGGGIDTVEASITHTLSLEVENLVLTGTSCHQWDRQHPCKRPHRECRRQCPDRRCWRRHNQWHLWRGHVGRWPGKRCSELRRQRGHVLDASQRRVRRDQQSRRQRHRLRCPFFPWYWHPIGGRSVDARRRRRFRRPDHFGRRRQPGDHCATSLPVDRRQSLGRHFKHSFRRWDGVVSLHDRRQYS